MLEARGFEVVRLREPGGTAIGDKLRSIVLDPGNAAMCDACELLVYEAARAQIVEEVIKPALDRGAVVLCDRFFDSTTAYQAYGRGLDADFVRRANQFACQGIVPDRTILLVPPSTKDGLVRATKNDGADRLESAGVEFHERVRNAFAEIAADDPKRIRTVYSVDKKSKTFSGCFAELASIFPFTVELGLRMNRARICTARHQEASYRKSDVCRSRFAFEKRGRIMSDVFDGIFGQPKVRDFLRACVRGDRVSHAYLFTGPAGSNKTAAAFALAKAIVCEGDPCSSCEACSADTCRRIDRKSHPDVHYLAPEGAQGYVVEQIRELVADSQLAPLAGRHKVYILDRVDSLGTSAANAFLKTPEDARRRHDHLAWPHPRSRAVDYRVALSSCAVSSYSGERGVGHSGPEYGLHSSRGRHCYSGGGRLHHEGGSVFTLQGARRVPHENHRCHGLAFARR